MVQNTTVSAVSPISVEPIVRTQSHFSPVSLRIQSRLQALESDQARYPKILPSVIRGTSPRITS